MANKITECFFVGGIENNFLYLHIRKNFKEKFENARANDPCNFDILISKIIADEIECNPEEIELIRDYYEHTGSPNLYDCNLVIEFRRRVRKLETCGLCIPTGEAKLLYR